MLAFFVNKIQVKKIPAVLFIHLLIIHLFIPSPAISAENTMLQLVNDYREILRADAYSGFVPKVGSSNRGLKLYLGSLYAGDEKLTAKAEQFYKKVAELSKNKPRINFTSEAGVEPFQDFPPGWLWKLAVSVGGDEKTAMRLIALCGHDDIHQISIETNSDLYFKISCPGKKSVFFLPKSLDGNIDIPDNLKQELLKIQGEDYRLNMGHPEIEMSPKHYHVYAAACISCEMISRGHKPEDIVENQVRLGKAYRLLKFFHIEGTNSELEAEFEDAKLLAVSKNAFKPIWWSNERYRKAVSRLETWRLDYRWTSQQHEVGAKWAARNCKSESNIKCN